MQNTNIVNSTAQAVKRVRLWYGLLLVVVAIFGVRLFYVQIIRYDHYKVAALSDQLKQYEIPASRGNIQAHNGASTLPIVLNQQLFTLYGDPVYIKKPQEVADKIVPIIGGNAAQYLKQLKQKDTRYVILGKKLTNEQQKKIAALKVPGLGTQAQNYRTYPQNSLAAQVLGFVNDEGAGKYGIEQALNAELKGKPGLLKAITDVNGVPLAASKDNIQQAPVEGKDVLLTLDLAMQQQTESVLADAVKSTRASGASAVILDPRDGSIKAMANVPTYDPSKYFNVEDGKLFGNAAVSEPIEIGSIMKPLTTAAAIDQGVIAPSTSYYDPASWLVDGFRITNIEEDGGAGTRNIADVLNLSLNTGATWELMQMGSGKINAKAREAWHSYMVDHYYFGRTTGVEQGFEAEGYVPPPADNDAGINLTYANTTFGQAMTATPVQVAAAYASMVNGGTMYKPHILEGTIDGAGKKIVNKPKVLKQGVVSPKTSAAMLPLMQNVVAKHHFNPDFDYTAYTVGGKTGTAQIAKPGGGYYADKFNGTYAGFVGGDEAQYVIVVFVDKPTNGGYAGTAAAQPVFGKLAHMLINDSYVMPKKQ
ncbi:MAG: penicillin-binding protein 2 [Patescibacteria group bacterium]|nr:penicillin-binding protein 2 [Patescibacteria group bacterium]